MNARVSRLRWLGWAAGLILFLCVLRAFGDACDPDGTNQILRSVYAGGSAYCDCPGTPQAGDNVEGAVDTSKRVIRTDSVRRYTCQ